jgi:hypothetical protein
MVGLEMVQISREGDAVMARQMLNMRSPLLIFLRLLFAKSTAFYTQKAGF